MLRDRKHRRREQAFVVEGIQPVWQAVEAGAEIEALVVAPELLSSPAAGSMVAEQERKGVRVVRVTGELFVRLSDREGPPGLAAIVHGQAGRLEELASTSTSLFVALHEVANPGNLGTTIRTADSVAASGLILVGQAADPFSPVAVKASMGALFNVPIAEAADPAALISWARERAIAVLTTSPKAETSLWEAQYRLPLVVLLGSEGRGLPAALLGEGDVEVRVPMLGTAESLNLAVAAAVLLYEIRRRFPAG